MRTVVFSTKSYDRLFLDEANRTHRHELMFVEPRLDAATAVLASEAQAVCPFVNDRLDATVLQRLAGFGVGLVALRCAGFNNVDLPTAGRLGISVARVPAYSPHAVAEHTVGMILALNRQLHRAFARVREGNFALEGLLGFDLNERTVGIVGTGKIGAVVARILNGFGCRLLAHDVAADQDCVSLGVRYVPLRELLAASDIVTLHCPLTPATRHMIDEAALSRMKHGAMLINTSRGALIDTPAVTNALKDGRLGYLGLDVYEEEADLFFENLSDRVLQDDVFARLLTFPNVLITGHQAFFTREALSNIAATTLANITAFSQTGRALHEVSTDKLA
jgi:D-lactate dehydrogenase